MKRYRVVLLHFDLTANHLLSLEAVYKNNPSEQLMQQITQVQEKFGVRYGQINLEDKLENLRKLGSKKLSIVAYHNELIEQIRDTFICCHYYPALTGACALGERILNHLVLDLKSYYQTTENCDEPIFTSKSFSNWNIMISKLDEWGVLLPEVSALFKKLLVLRHKSIHFNNSLIPKLKDEALKALTLIQDIIGHQFSAFGSQPWFITNIPGEIYLKREWETKPFIKEYYVKINAIYLGPSHRVINVFPSWKFEDYLYTDEEITDEKFAELRAISKSSSSKKSF